MPRDDALCSASLNGRADELERRLEQPEDEELHHHVVGSVREAIEHFEVEHPTATGILNHIMVTLSNMGI